jgi:hypothetical protein
MQAVADAEDWDAEFEDLRVRSGRIGVVNGRRSAGEDDAQRMKRLNFADRRGAGQHDGEDVLLAGAACDELCVLGAEVEDYYCLGVHLLLWQGRVSV